MIAIIDYKAGNLTSVKKAFDHLGAETIVTADARDRRRSRQSCAARRRTFLPRRSALDDSGLRESIVNSIERSALSSAFAWGCNGCWRRVKRPPTFTGLRSGRANAADFQAGSSRRTWAGTICRFGPANRGC